MHIFKNLTLRLLLIAVIGSLFIMSCNSKNKGSENKTEILLFIPGERNSGNIYDTLATGVERAVEEAKKNNKPVSLTVVEAGLSQSLWLDKLTAVTAEEKYDLIISSNPSLPDLIKIVLEQFPNQQFLVFDAFSNGMPQITSFNYNQHEQAYVSGFISALVTTSKMKYANDKIKIGLIAGQEYPVMNEIILPAYIEGAKAVHPEIEVDFRIVGNWYDASKGYRLAQTMYANGCDVIMPIAGGANQGVVSCATDLGFYISWFDANGYNKAKGYVIGSSTIDQDKLAFEQTLKFINGTMKKGLHTTLTMADGYVRFIEDDPVFISTVPEDIRKLQSNMIKKILSGELKLSVD
ncbi:MAG: BMP family ABC transporter substrate-binding protein [Treponema sp.]|nr:MAG: BMP family ABC transporter substrate-binding protein [Treponema sp.]